MTEKRPRTDALLDIASRPVFPFLVIKLKKAGGSIAPSHIELRVPNEVYDYFQRVFGTDELLLYFDPQAAEVRIWSPDMHLTFDILEKKGFFPSKVDWVKEAREYLIRFLSRVRFP